jgi:hypothetical protein
MLSQDTVTPCKGSAASNRNKIFKNSFKNLNFSTYLIFCCILSFRLVDVKNIFPFVKMKRKAGQWLTPVILAIQEADMRRISVRSQPGQIVL